MIDERTLRKNAREAIQTGRLPNRQPTQMWGGNGFGASCAVCDNVVKPDEVGYEVEFAQAGDSAASEAYHIHVRCYAAWELERHTLTGQTAESAGPSAGADSNSSLHMDGHAGPLPAGPNGRTIAHRERHSREREST